jgi:hypothetical protein
MVKKKSTLEELQLRNQLLSMPRDALINIYEAAIVTGLTVGTLRNRSYQKLWPQPVRLRHAGRIIRYRLGDLLSNPGG